MKFSRICKDCLHKNVCIKRKECEKLVDEIKKEVGFKFTIENGFDLDMICKDFTTVTYCEDYSEYY